MCKLLIIWVYLDKSFIWICIYVDFVINLLKDVKVLRINNLIIVGIMKNFKLIFIIVYFND